MVYKGGHAAYIHLYCLHRKSTEFEVQYHILTKLHFKEKTENTD